VDTVGRLPNDVRQPEPSARWKKPARNPPDAACATPLPIIEGDPLAADRRPLLLSPGNN
jgi:hypothetical protein